MSAGSTTGEHDVMTNRARDRTCHGSSWPRPWVAPRDCLRATNVGAGLLPADSRAMPRRSVIIRLMPPPVMALPMRAGRSKFSWAQLIRGSRHGPNRCCSRRAGAGEPPLMPNWNPHTPPCTAGIRSIGPMDLLHGPRKLRSGGNRPGGTNSSPAAGDESESLVIACCHGPLSK